MASVLEYATLSRHIYDIKRPLFGLSSKVALIHRYSNIMSHSNKWYLATDASHTMTPLHDLYAGLYIQFRYGKAKEAVIAIRGTQLLKAGDDWEDLTSWGLPFFDHRFNASIPDDFYRAFHFYIRAKEYLKKYFPSVTRLAVTGHSLGGSLAQLIVAHGNRPMDCVTFNAPGIASIAEVNPETGEYIININSLYGLLNKVGKVLGEIDYVDVKPGSEQLKKIFEAYIASQHPSMVSPSAPNLIKQYGLTDNLDLNELGLTHADEAETLLTQDISSLLELAYKAGHLDAILEQHSITSLLQAIEQDEGVLLAA